MIPFKLSFYFRPQNYGQDVKVPRQADMIIQGLLLGARSRHYESGRDACTRAYPDCDAYMENEVHQEMNQGFQDMNQS